MRRGAGPLLGAATLLAMIWCLAPVLWQLVTSLKSEGQLYLSPPTWLPWAPTLAHYRAVLGEALFVDAVINSALIASGSTAIALGLGAPAAFALARLRPAGSRAILGFFLAGCPAASVSDAGCPHLLVFNRGQEITPAR